MGPPQKESKCPLRLRGSAEQARTVQDISPFTFRAADNLLDSLSSPKREEIPSFYDRVSLSYLCWIPSHNLRSLTLIDCDGATHIVEVLRKRREDAFMAGRVSLGSLRGWALTMIGKRMEITRPPSDEERLSDMDASSGSSGDSDYSCETVDEAFNLV